MLEKQSGIDELSVEIRRAVVRMYKRLRAERPDDQMSDAQSAVLTLLVKHGPLTLGALSQQERVTPPSMNQTVNVLVAAGYVTRKSDPTDRRKVLFVATESGQALTAENIHRRHTWLAARLNGMSAESRATLMEASRILQEMAEV